MADDSFKEDSFHEDLPSDSFHEDQGGILPTVIKLLSGGLHPALQMSKSGSLPTAGSIAGGVVGGPEGAGLGAMAGKAIEQPLEMLDPRSPSKSLGQRGLDVLTSGRDALLQDATGRGVAKAFEGAAPWLYKKALGPTLKEAKKGVVETGMKEGIPVTSRIAEIAGDSKEGLNDEINNIINQHTGNPNSRIDMLKVKTNIAKQMSDMFNGMQNRLAGMPKGDFEDIVNKAGAKMDEYPPTVDMRHAQKIASYWQGESSNKFGKLSEPESEVYKRIGDVVRREMEGIDPRLVEPHARVGKLIDFQRAADRVAHKGQDTNQLSDLAKRTIMSAMLGGSVGGLGGYQQGGASGMAAPAMGGAALGAILGSPSFQSRAALGLINPIAKEGLPAALKTSDLIKQWLDNGKQ